MKMFQRFFGVVTFKSHAYREIIENASLWKESALLIILSALSSSFSFTLQNGFTPQSIVRLTIPLINWVLFGYLCAFFMKAIYKLDIPAVNVLKIYAYAQLIGFLGLLLKMWTGNYLLWQFGNILLILSLVAEIIGVREAGQLSNVRAIVIFFLSFFIVTIFALIYGRIIVSLV